MDNHVYSLFISEASRLKYKRPVPIHSYIRAAFFIAIDLSPKGRHRFARAKYSPRGEYKNMNLNVDQLASRARALRRAATEKIRREIFSRLKPDSNSRVNREKS